MPAAFARVSTHKRTLQAENDPIKAPFRAGDRLLHAEWSVSPPSSLQPRDVHPPCWGRIPPGAAAPETSMASTGLDLNGKRNCHRDPRNQFGRMNVHTLVSVTLANAERTNPGHLSVKDNESNGGRRDGKQKNDRKNRRYIF